MLRLLPAFLLLISSVLNGQDQARSSLFDSLYTAGEVHIRLVYPFDSVYRNREDEVEAMITMRIGQTYLMLDEPMTINLRGKFRRITCEMPPLMLNFKKSTLRNLGLSAQDELKLVTHCMYGPEGQKNLEEELLCYQLYEALTPYSYRSIWVSVEYCDTSHPDSCHTSAGLLLEPDKNIELRLGLKEKKLYNLPGDSLDYDSYCLLTAFNFLIGNRDWSVNSSRNAKLFYKPELHKYIVIPYDFDYANIVGALYRKERLPPQMTHPFDRIYYGEYFPEKAAEILQTFSRHESVLLQVIQSPKNTMDADRRQRITKYFEQWFSQIRRTNTNKMQYGLVIPYKGGL